MRGEMHFLLYLAAMTLPGLALTAALRLDACRAATAVAFSVSLLVGAVVASRAAGLGVEAFGWLLLAGYAAVALAVAAWWRRERPRFSGVRIDRVHAIPAGTLLAVAAYAAWAGPYTEVPADAWFHIAHIREWLADLAENDLDGYRALPEVFDKSAKHWHLLEAYFLYVTGVGLDRGLAGLAVVNTLLLAAAVYAFALVVFQKLISARAWRHAAAASAVFFFITQFGVSVFSYVRYYTFAPTLAAYIVYLAALGCFIAFLRIEQGGYRYLAATLVFAAVAAAVHKQEALFIAVMAGGILAWEYVLTARRLGPAWMIGAPRSRDGGRPRVALFLAAFVIAYLLVHVWMYLFVHRNHPLSHGLMADIRNYLPFLQNLYVLKPTGQFYQVLTIWGVMVYVLFLVHIKRFACNAYLVVGMALPLLTVFNPVFTDFFLRVSWPQVLWRMGYALPLPLVGGYFLCRSIDNTLRGPGPRARLLGLAGVAALVGLLLPFHSTFVTSPYSKIYTLAPVDAANDHRLWRDLIGFLRQRDSEGVITDPVTGYIVGSLTAHRYPGYKFFGRDGFPVNGERYRARDFKRRDGWLVVINRRDGDSSAAGRYGGHWPEDVMQVSQRYSRAFKRYVRRHPDRFDKLWSRDRIAVYRIDN